MMVTDDRRNPDFMLRYLDGILLPRVRERAVLLTTGYTPQFKTGSVMGTVDHRYESGSEDDSPVFDLNISLMEWRKGSRSSVIAQAQYARWLAKHGVTDVEHLLGSGRFDIGRGLLWETRRETRLMLTPILKGQLEGARNFSQAVDKTWELIILLRDFAANDCNHDFQPMNGGAEFGAEACTRCGLPKMMETA